MFQKSYPPGAPRREENLHSYWKKIWISLFLPDYCYQTVEISIHGVGKVKICCYNPDKMACVTYCEYAAWTGTQQGFCQQITGVTNQMVSTCHLQP